MASRSNGDGRGSQASRRSNSSQSNRRPLSLEEVISMSPDHISPPPLDFGDRIVWLSDSGPEYGWVKWLGKLPDVGNDWMAGVDFDHPVGSGTGLYNDHQLFEAPMNHASLVPVMGLMKADDFGGNGAYNSHITASPSRPVRVTRRNDQYSLPPISDPHKYQQQQQQQSSYVQDLASLHPSLPPSSSTNSSIHNLQQHLANLNLPELKSSQSDVDNYSSSSITSRSRLLSSSSQVSPPRYTLSSSASLPNPSNPPPPSNLQNVRRLEINNILSQRTELPDIDVVDRSNNISVPNSLQSSSNRILRPVNLVNSPPLSSSAQVNGGDVVKNGSDEDELEVGSLVEVTIDDIPRYGVIRWIGFLDDPNDSPNSGDIYDEDEENKVAGVELEEECPGCCDGTWNGRRYFSCQSKKGYFVLLSGCRKDSRFNWDRNKSALFGNIECPIVTGDVSPLTTPKDLQALCGKNRGIQGHHNSCYLDATLFAMFSCTTIFDSLLTRPPNGMDIPEYSEVQRVLKEEIVNPLRANLYVRADRVMHLRTLLEKLSSVRGLTSEEKDPEEFLNLLLNEILKADPYLKLSSGLETFFYQLFVEKDEKLVLPTVQQLFDQSFLASDIKLREIPPCLLMQMPRFGRQFKMYPRIIPSLYLDITDVLEGSARQCCICGQVADLECKECFGQFGEGLESTAFCVKCLEKSHAHKKRTKHSITNLTVPHEYKTSLVIDPQTGSSSALQVPRVFMELFAVLCIETSHYVAFVKCGTGPDAPWCFFDSMADRKGEQNGYNIPEVVSFSDLGWWLSEEGTVFLLTTKDDKVLPEMARRLLCDAYMCFYQSTSSNTTTTAATSDNISSRNISR